MNKTSEKSARIFKNDLGMKKLFGGFAYFVCGFIISFSQFPLYARPLGVALLASCTRGNAKLRLYTDFAFFMLCGGITAASLTYEKNGILYFSMYCALFLIRFALTGGKFNESRAVKMALSLTSSLCIGFVGGAINGFGLWEILGILVLAICAPIFACLFDGISDAEESPIVRTAGVGAFLFAILYGIKSVHIFSFSFSLVVSAFITLCVAKKKGALYGALCGLVCGIAGENFILPPVLGILGFSAGIFFEYSDIFSLLIAYVGAICYGIYCTGFDAVGYLAPEFLIACAAFFPLKNLFKPMPSLPAACDMQYGADTLDDAENDQRLVKISDAFSALSEIALDVENPTFPDKSECLHFVKRSFEKNCADCIMREMCEFRGEAQGGALKSSLAELLYEKRLSAANLPAEFGAKCRKSAEIESDLAEKCRAAAPSRRLPTRDKFLSGEYNTVAKLFRSTASRREKPHVLTDGFRLKRALDDLKISYKNFEIKGSRRATVDIVGVTSADIEHSSEKIRAEIEKECGFSVTLPDFFVRDSLEVMRVVRRPSVSLEYAKAAKPKSGEQHNGDCISVFENDDDCFFSLICDGMGSGRDAAAASRTASGFIEKLIASSSPEEITIEMLNNFLISKENECFSTIDLLEIDKLESTASFIKAGAAPSFVIRGGKLHKISSDTPPAGVLYSMTAEKTVMKIQRNDIIVMLSDGILENGELAPWLMELLTYELDGSPDDMAKKIISDAVEKCGRSDDMSVAVMRIA